MRIIQILVVGVGLLVAGCAGGIGPKQTMGCVGGAAAGGLAGAQFGAGSGQLVMTAIGTLVGAAAGCSIGESMDRVDQMTIQQNSRRVMEYGQPMQWQNPDNGNQFHSNVTRYGQNQYGHQCREVVTQGYVGGRPVEIVSNGCRQPDGTWRMVN